MKKIFNVIALVFVVCISSYAYTSPEKMLNDMLKTIKSSDFKSDMTFKVVDSQGSVLTETEADFVVSDRKYALHMDDGMAVFYNGDIQWIYVPEANEVTLTEPTDEELFESNPVMAIESKVKTHKILYAENCTDSSSVINIFPDNPKECEYFKVELSLSQKDLLPQKIVVFNRNGDKVVINWKSWNKTKTDMSDFSFNAADYPGVMVNDLR